MNRIIKFRAFDKKRNKLFDVDGIFNHPTNENIICVQGYDYEPNKIGWWNKEDLELMQYTGLTDKNGVEIYEGDVIKEMFSHGEEKCEIVFEKAGFFIKNEKAEISDNLHWHYNGLEVIGNVMENPDLLNK